MSKGNRRFGVFAGIGILAFLIAATRDPLKSLLFPSPTTTSEQHADGHAHPHNDEVKGIVLSDTAKASLGLELGPIVLQDYWRNLPIPGEVVEEPGHCEQGVSTTAQGIVLRIHAFHGQTVRAGDPLFDLRLTSELLVSAQTGLLKSVQEIEIVQAELERILPLVESKGIPATRGIEKQNELKRLESLRQLQSQELIVRGLSAQQVEQLVRTKTLIQELTIRVPEGQGSAQAVPDKASRDFKPGDIIPVSALEPHTEQHEHSSVYSIEDMNVHPGKLVQPGEEMCRLARHSQLLIAGRAFERESFLVTRAIEQNWPIKAVFEMTDTSPVIREGLSILYSDNVVEPDSRTVRFYTPLPNEIVRDQPAANGLAYRSWRFKPGQRARILLPVEHLTKQIVLPSEAVVKEGPEVFVFRANGKRLDRVPVRLTHMDLRDAVIKSDGTLVAGDVVARNQAFQLELALKSAQGNRGGGHGHDHGGHSHAGHEH